METRLVHYVNRLKKYDSRKYTRISRCGHSVATCRPLLLVHVQFSKWHSWKLPNSTDPRVIVCRNYRSCWQHRRLGCPRSRKIRGLEQDRQCSYSAILRRVRVTAVTAEKQQVLHILCVCVCVCLQPQLPSMHSAWAVIYCHLWPVRLHHVFSTSPHTRHDFRMKVTEHQMCDFCRRLSSDALLIIRGIRRDLWKQVA